MCAAQLATGTADLGLIPIAALTPQLAVVPGCTIASLHNVRSILLLVKNPQRLNAAAALMQIHAVAADTASLSSVAYARILFEHFHDSRPTSSSNRQTRSLCSPKPMLRCSSATPRCWHESAAPKSKPPSMHRCSGWTSPSFGANAPAFPGSLRSGPCASNHSPGYRPNSSPPT